MQLPLPATLPSPPSALAQALNGLGAIAGRDLAGLGQRLALAAAAAPPRASAICWPSAFMNSAPLCTFIVPKSA